MAGSILEQFADLKSDYEIGKTSRIASGPKRGF